MTSPFTNKNCIYLVLRNFGQKGSDGNISTCLVTWHHGEFILE